MNEKCMTDADGDDTDWVWEPTKRFITAKRYTNWSKKGGFGAVSQPDNYTTNEGCIAILNNWYNDGLKWHDLECQDKFPFVCERVF